MAKPHLGEEETQAARETILSGWVTQGPKVQAFETAFKEYVGAQHACAVSSCTAALHLSLLAVGVKPGNVVLTVSHSFIATANSIRYGNAEPVFVDIEPDTFNMSPERLQRCLTEDCAEKGGGLYYKDVERLAVGESPLTYIKPSSEYGRVAAILVVHQMGLPCDLGSILPLARKYQLPVVEDAACAIGSEISFDEGGQWEKIGKPHGDLACFSFHPRKLLTTGDGGMITTNNSEYDQDVRLLRHQGMSVSDLDRHGQDKIIFESYEKTAFNYRLTDIQAAIGIEQLRKIPEAVKTRRALVKMYQSALRDVPWIKVTEEPAYAKSNWQSFPVRVLDGAPKSRNELMQYLLDYGISTRPGIMNAHQEIPYHGNSFQLENSVEAKSSSLLLPLYQGMEKEDIDRITDLMRNG